MRAMRQNTVADAHTHEPRDLLTTPGTGLDTRTDKVRPSYIFSRSPSGALRGDSERAPGALLRTPASKQYVGEAVGREVISTRHGAMVSMPIYRGLRTPMHQSSRTSRMAP